jgi:hypothetical protein
MHAGQGARCQADVLCYAADQASCLRACEPAHEQPTRLAAGIELAGGDHLVLDPARRERILSEADHLRLGHRAADSSVAQNDQWLFDDEVEAEQIDEATTTT